MVRVLFSVALAAIALVSCESGDDRPLPVEPNRTLRDELRSDARSWLSARVRDPQKIAAVSRIDPGQVRDLEGLAEALAVVGVDSSLSSLRWRRIAERRGEPLPAESVVVEEFLAAAKELAE